MFCKVNMRVLEFLGLCRLVSFDPHAQPAKTDRNKKSLPKQKTNQNFTIDAQGFRKTKNENPPTWEIRVTS